MLKKNLNASKPSEHIFAEPLHVKCNPSIAGNLTGHQTLFSVSLLFRFWNSDSNWLYKL